MIDRLAPLMLGIVLAMYWGRVLRMARKARLRTGRAANLLPGERLGKMLRVAWAPIVVIWVAHPFCTAFWRHPPPALAPLYFRPWIAWPALVVAIACFLLTRICWKTMGRHWRMGIDPAERNPIIAAGPFARVRHPIYALSMLMMLATMAMIPSPLLLAAGAGHCLLLLWESRREEAHLLRVHGEGYRNYRRQAGAFFPRIAK